MAARTASSCPFGVVERNPDDGRAFKCTFCYDRQKEGLQPACAKACPTESIKFGEIDDLRETAQSAMANLRRTDLPTCICMIRGIRALAGIHAFFIVRGDPEPL